MRNDNETNKKKKNGHWKSIELLLLSSGVLILALHAVSSNIQPAGKSRPDRFWLEIIVVI